MKLPDNVEILNVERIIVNKSRLMFVVRNITYMLAILINEFYHCESRPYFIKRIRLTISEILFSLVLAEKIRVSALKEKKPVIHYSFWMNAYPLALSILKRKGLINNYSFRVHGFDLYRERWPHGYIPFRINNYKYCNRVYAVSKLGLEYIQQYFKFSERAACSYLGTADHGKNPFDDQNFTLFTCSTILPLKRLNLIAESLRHITFPLTWYHFGAGTKEEEDKLRNELALLPSNVKVILKGQVSQEELFDAYRTIPASVFMNTSETEGLPVSIMEATSFGIPVVATDVGGTKEIVTEQTGWLVHKDIKAAELAAVLAEFINSRLNTLAFRAGVRKFWSESFSAEKNYKAFCLDLQNN